MSRTRTQVEDQRQVAAGSRLRIRRADLHVVAGRFIDRHERRGESATGNKLAFDPSLDVNETAAIVLAAKRGRQYREDRQRQESEGRSVGGLHSRRWLTKNFLLQTEPQIQEVLGIDERGHDYFLQVTDARPDTGGLSGATPGEAVSWGK